MFNINMVAKPPLSLNQLSSSFMQVKPGIGPLSNLANLGNIVGGTPGGAQMGGMPGGAQMGGMPGGVTNDPFQGQRDFNSQPQNAFINQNRPGASMGQQSMPFQGQRDFNSQPQNAFINQNVHNGYGNQPQGGYSNQPQMNQMPQGGYGNQPQGGYNNQPRGGYGNQPQMGQPQMQQPAIKKRNFGNGVVLQKGQKTSLSKMCPGLDLIHVGIGWDLGHNGQSYDLDVEAFMLGSNGKVIGDDWFVFYNQPNSPDGSVNLIASSTDGAGDGDDEIIQVQLSKVNPAVSKIVFIISINDAKVYGYNFSNIANAYVRVVDMRSGKELTRFQLTDYYETVNSMMVGEVYLHNGEWKFNAIGNGVSADLADLCVRYGVNLA